MQHTWRKVEIACYKLLSEELLERDHNNLDLVRKILPTWVLDKSVCVCMLDATGIGQSQMANCCEKCD